MSAPQQPGSTPPAALPARLRELAGLVREADHLEPEAQDSLASLADEMANTLSKSHVPTAEEAELGHLASELIEALHREETPAAGTRHRLQEAILAAETRAPFAATIARQLLEALANLGI
jgi:Domain of unknown function (DUF4404)